jgi:predicted transporter
MTIIITILAWLLCGFAGSYIGHRWADKCKNDTVLGSVLWMALFGPFTVLGVIVVIANESFDFDLVVFKRKSK